MPTKLQLYNQALLHLRESTLVDLNEARESRRNLDVVYDDVLKLMLEAGFWKFAMRSIQITADTSITPAFGPSFAFDKPTDWVKTYFVSASETFDPPLDGWLEESNLFFADINPLYLRYVSNADPGYGLDLDRWTSRFTQAVVFELAWRICPKTTGSSDSLAAKIEKDKVLALSKALSFEALREPPRRPLNGRWNQARTAVTRRGNWSGGYRIG